MMMTPVGDTRHRTVVTVGRTARTSFIDRSVRYAWTVSDSYTVSVTVADSCIGVGI